MREQPLVSAQEIADAIGGGITARTVLRWAQQKRIPSCRINRRVIRFDKAEVRKRLKERH